MVGLIKIEVMLLLQLIFVLRHKLDKIFISLKNNIFNFHGSLQLTVNTY